LYGSGNREPGFLTQKAQMPVMVNANPSQRGVRDHVSPASELGRRERLGFRSAFPTAERFGAISCYALLQIRIPRFVIKRFKPNLKISKIRHLSGRLILPGFPFLLQEIGEWSWA
jgi:hypothetical protein